MTKIWLYFKKVMVVWGIIWLVIVLAFGVGIYIDSRPQVEPLQQGDSQVEMFKKKEAGLDLSVTRDPKNGSRLLLNLLQDHNQLLRDYALPAGEFGLDGVEVSDADISQVADGHYRIILQGGSYDCDQESQHFLWVLDYGDGMKLVRMLVVYGLHEIAERKDRFFANEIIQLPAFGEEEQEQIIIPVEVGIGDTVSVRPMLSASSKTLIRQHYTELIGKRMAQLSQAGNDQVRERYRAALQRLDMELKG